MPSIRYSLVTEGRLMWFSKGTLSLSFEKEKDFQERGLSFLYASRSSSPSSPTLSLSHWPLPLLSLDPRLIQKKSTDRIKLFHKSGKLAAGHFPTHTKPACCGIGLYFSLFFVCKLGLVMSNWFLGKWETLTVQRWSSAHLSHVRSPGAWPPGMCCGLSEYQKC